MENKKFAMNFRPYSYKKDGKVYLQLEFASTLNGLAMDYAMNFHAKDKNPFQSEVAKVINKIGLKGSCLPNDIAVEKNGTKYHIPTILFMTKPVEIEKDCSLETILELGSKIYNEELPQEFKDSICPQETNKESLKADTLDACCGVSGDYGSKLSQEVYLDNMFSSESSPYLLGEKEINNHKEKIINEHNSKSNNYISYM